jgi:DNA-binding NtrC family response regulator
MEAYPISGVITETSISDLRSQESQTEVTDGFRALRHRKLTQDRDREERSLKEQLGLQLLVGRSLAFRATIHRLPTLARCDASVLILGETGTGKELCARAIHYLSPRSQQPFVPVNCGAIPSELVENELFGHMPGAFTGASTAHRGLIEEANGGTLFLDEIASLPLLAQVKLLRFVQDREYRPLGAAKSKRVSLRIIAATNVSLEEAIRNGKFRQDLYYRLNVLPLELPSLRQRREDIPLLAWHFLRKYADEFDKPVTGFSADALQVMNSYGWPGNVRELEHIVQRAVVLCESETIDRADISLPIPSQTTGPESFHQAKARAIAEFERGYLQSLLAAHLGNVTKAAQAAQKNRRAFWQLLRKHGIKASDFKPSA